jgi:hypothetical protein
VTIQELPNFLIGLNQISYNTLALKIISQKTIFFFIYFIQTLKNYLKKENKIKLLGHPYQKSRVVTTTNDNTLGVALATPSHLWVHYCLPNVA